MIKLPLRVQVIENDLVYNDIQELIKEYKETLRIVKRRRDETDLYQVYDIKIMGQMISDLEYVIKWLETARRPGNRRGVERLATYQREKPIDPLHIQRYFQASGGDPYKMIDLEHTDTITQADRERLEDAMCELTEIEREYYMLHHGYGFSFADIGNMFCVAKGTVQKTVERAEKKITKRINESLFCLVG